MWYKKLGTTCPRILETFEKQGKRRDFSYTLKKLNNFFFIKLESLFIQIILHIHFSIFYLTKCNIKLKNRKKNIEFYSSVLVITIWGKVVYTWGNMVHIWVRQSICNMSFCKERVNKNKNIYKFFKIYFFSCAQIFFYSFVLFLLILSIYNLFIHGTSFFVLRYFEPILFFFLNVPLIFKEINRNFF